MHRIKEMLEEELRKYEGKSLSTGSLDIIHKITDTIKNIDKIEMLETGEGYSQRRGYSKDGEWEARGDYSNNSYDGGMSTARRGMHYVRGHYSRDGASYDGNSYGSYHNGNYSMDGAKDDMIRRLEDMMERTDREQDREAIKRCVDQLRG